jgi:hypothetical protein
VSALKDYLGDGVYADFDGFAIILTAENGIAASDTIYLEPGVLDALVRYRERMKQLPPAEVQASGKAAAQEGGE